MTTQNIVEQLPYVIHVTDMELQLLSWYRLSTDKGKKFILESVLSISQSHLDEAALKKRRTTDRPR